MLTLLCSPKPFVGEVGRNQLNALRSWQAMDAQVEIFVFGASAGAAEAAQAVNAQHVAEIEASASGAPSFNAMARHAAQSGRFDLQVYINSDILLDRSLIEALQAARARFEQFLLVGERMDLAEGVFVDVQNPHWLKDVSDQASAGRLTPHGPTGVDYFGFVRGMWQKLPPVFMGRAMCDQALLHNALRSHLPVIDATLAVKIIHQFHGYGHVTGGRQEVFHGEDRDTMARLHGLKYSLPTVADADWRFDEHGTLQPDRVRRSWLRRAEYGLRYKYGLDRVSLVMRSLQYLAGGRGSIYRKLSGEAILKAWQLS